MKQREQTSNCGIGFHDGWHSLLVIIAKQQFNRSCPIRLVRYLIAVVSSFLVLVNYAVADEDFTSKYRQSIAEWPPFEVDETVDAIDIGLLPPLPEVEWHTAPTEELGKFLFFDPRLSSSQQIACGSCHDPNLGWGDGRRVSFGHDRVRGRRNAMTLLNAARFNELFWDGRAKGLLDLILIPLQSEIEMDADIEEVLQRIRDIPEYQTKFKEAFEDETINEERIAIAIASFVRSIQSSPSDFDHFVNGDRQRLTDQEIEGLHLFRTKARCMNCHHGPLFSDGEFHHTGLSYYGRRFEDRGRFEATGEEEDMSKFRTPSLRDLEFTGPWMHNGLFTNFTGILRMYNHGVTFNSRVRERSPPLSPLIQPLELSDEEIGALEAFLKTLSRIPYFIEAPRPLGLERPDSDAVYPMPGETPSRDDPEY